MTELIQIADDHGTDTSIVRLIGKGDDDLVPLFTYMISESDTGKFFLQIASPNRNLSRFAPNPFDTISLSQMLALIEDHGYEQDAIVANISYYDATVEGVIEEDGTASTPYIRPTTGATAREAQTEEIIRYLQLPAYDEDSYRIGRLARSGEAEVPINLSPNILNHHILVAGSTGSGKSHLLSNIAHATAQQGRCVILFDHKPDHQNHHEPNLESDRPQGFTQENDARGYPVVRYWTLDRSDPNPNAKLLAVRSMDLSAELLAGTIFYRENEENQAEVYAHIAETYAADKRERDEVWTVYDINEYIKANNGRALSSYLYGQDGGQISGSTLNAIKAKMNRPGRVPSFVDPVIQPDVLGNVPNTSDIDNVFQPGLNVIRISEGSERGYALFLSRLLQRAEALRTGALAPDSSVADSVPALEIIIDEAADIFRAPSRFLRSNATAELAERIRKGRSLHTGYVIAVQSSGDVPENVRNNLNTTIVGRHRNMNVLREALPTAKPGMLERADILRPGEMLVDMFGVRSLLSVKMDLSRSKLTVVD